MAWPNVRGDVQLGTVAGDVIAQALGQILLLVLLVALAGAAYVAYGGEEATHGTVDPVEAVAQAAVPFGTSSGAAVLLLVESGEAAAALRAAAPLDRVIGHRGDVDLTVTVVADDVVARTLIAMLLGNEGMCPGTACGEVLVVDLRRGH